MHFFGIGSAFLMEQGGTIRSTGELAGADMAIAPTGSRSSQVGHALGQLVADHARPFLLLRQTYLDRRTEVRAVQDRADRRTGAPAPLNPQFCGGASARPTGYRQHWKWADWTIPSSG
jgi:hypothetical protein